MLIECCKSWDPRILCGYSCTSATGIRALRVPPLRSVCYMLL